jgi:hypothetical protein
MLGVMLPGVNRCFVRDVDRAVLFMVRVRSAFCSSMLLSPWFTYCLAAFYNLCLNVCD